MIDKKIKAGFSRNYRASIDRIESPSRQVALIGDQREALKAIETYESEIAAAKGMMTAFAAKKKNDIGKVVMRGGREYGDY